MFYQTRTAVIPSVTDLLSRAVTREAEPLSVDELRHRQVARIMRARQLEQHADAAHTEALEHARQAAILDARGARDSEAASHAREVAGTWFAQARRLYEEANAIRTGLN